MACSSTSVPSPRPCATPLTRPGWSASGTPDTGARNGCRCSEDSIITTASTTASSTPTSMFAHGGIGTRFWIGTGTAAPSLNPAIRPFSLPREASQLIERHDGSRPFFLYVAFNAPHDPFQAPPEYIAQFSHLPYDLETRKQRAMVKAMDDAIGQVMDALERRGVLDETLVMVPER